MNSIIDGRLIHRVSNKFNHPKLKGLFNKDCYYNYNDFNKIISINMDRQYGGGIGNVIKDLFIGILEFGNSKKYDPTIKEFKENILEDKWSEVKTAYNDMTTTFKNRFKTNFKNTKL
tara:strand:- start:11 stop:361 length:351 start_codon:yes stop_codon:yes gene_type:complete